MFTPLLLLLSERERKRVRERQRETADRQTTDREANKYRQVALCVCV